MFSITKISFKFGDLKCSKLFSKTGIEDFLILLYSLKADKMADYKLYEKRKGYIYRKGYKMGKSTRALYICENNRRDRIEVYFQNDNTSIENYNEIFLKTNVDYLLESVDFDSFQKGGGIGIIVQ